MGEMPDQAARQPVGTVLRLDLLVALLDGSCLASAVPMTLDIVERDPLTTAGCFRGDLLRGLMEVPGSFWRSHPRLHDRYLAALRAGAERRRRLPPGERMEFWSVLDRATVYAVGGGHTTDA